MRKIKMGVFGLGRGSSQYDSILLNGGEIVAVCDVNEERLAKAKEKAKELVIANPILSALSSASTPQHML